ncbi:hypothetical protein A8F94_22245 [Bacillus sp. FJAT-27225]|uniref:MEDS domain-containing protein n=1 Tax=Bacillus sp. FJAT-27225 TaxID=1743144 RepID=UPI00080C2CEB|nr:MEDS domain-containing protein [Bacillus sp. FJAT-27225]OCA81592.1 hypothetical protein A8F94_22245 [Bacillus sp. FJAT-27225]
MDKRGYAKGVEFFNLSEGHVFYNTYSPDRYIDNLLLFIRSGLNQGQHCLIIENDRLWLRAKSRFSKNFTSKQLERVIHINNFDFYYYTGDFHTETIVDYFSKILSPYKERKFEVRTWTHVEWGNDIDMNTKIKQFEQKAEEDVSKLKLLAVCAYDGERLNKSLIESLHATHNYYLSDKV